MDHDPFAPWRAAMASLLATFATVELPYPKGEHRLHPPADSALVARLAIEVGTTGSAAALVGFYRHCDGADLPDVWNGYWIHPAELILRHRQEDPTSTAIGFGSDGGGNTFALRIADGAVAVQRWWRPDELVATDFPAFLERLRLDVDAFVHHTKAGSSSMAAANDHPARRPPHRSQAPEEPTRRTTHELLYGSTDVERLVKRTFRLVDGMVQGRGQQRGPRWKPRDASWRAWGVRPQPVVAGRWGRHDAPGHGGSVGHHTDVRGLGPQVGYPQEGAPD